MEVYILDTQYRRVHVIDVFESLIWTERWKSVGDFEMIVKSTSSNRGLLMPGTKLAMNLSDRVMGIEETEDTLNEEGEEMLLVKGRSLESILQHRVAWHDLSSTHPWYVTTSPIGLPRELFDKLCQTTAQWGSPLLDPNDELPFVSQRYPNEDVPTDEVVVDWVQDKPDTLYNAIKKHCDSYDVGFRLIREDDSSNLYFEVYTGKDRTTRQTDESPVIFSVSLDSIQNTTEFTSIRDHKNIAYALSEGHGHEKVLAPGGDPDVSGFDRRVLLVNVRVPQDYQDPEDLIKQTGREELQKRRTQSIFEGEVNEYNKYKYGVDYELGDLVEARNRDGVASYKHITEQIFVDDANGERAYPTLSIGRFENPNTWISWTVKDEDWEAFGSDAWEDM